MLYAESILLECMLQDIAARYGVLKVLNPLPVTAHPEG